MAKKIVVVVIGGVVQSVYADNNDVEIEVLDVDDLEAAGYSEREREKKISEAVKELKAVY